MKKQTIVTVCLLLLCLLFSGTAAADGLEVSGEVTGTCEGIAYVLPCFAADSEADDAITLWINGLAETGLAELFPQLMLAENGAQVKYSIARNDERYLCIVLEAET